jgi:hypothetical protein
LPIFFFLRLRGGISEARSTGAPLRACRKKSAQPPSNPRNFANFQAKTIRRPKPVITRLGAPLQIRVRSRVIPLASQHSSPGLCPLFFLYIMHKKRYISYSMSLYIIYRERDTSAARILTYADVCGRVRPHTLVVE